MRRLIAVIVLALALVATAGVVAYDTLDGVVSFPNANLESTVRQAIYVQLGKEATGPIYRADIEKLEALAISSPARISDDPEHELNYEPITDLKFLEHFTGLKLLMIFGTEVRDLSPLSSLTNLEALMLRSSEVTDLAPLSALPNLQFLSITECQVSDLSPLASITSLSELTLRDNRISDVSPLSSLRNLARIDLTNNRISDISPLVETTALGAGGYSVYLSGNPLDEQSANVHIPQLDARGYVAWE